MVTRLVPSAAIAALTNGVLAWPETASTARLTVRLREVFWWSAITGDQPPSSLPMDMNPAFSTSGGGVKSILADHSSPSGGDDIRYWTRTANGGTTLGFADRSQIVGRAFGVAVSLDPDHYYKPRWDRFFSGFATGAAKDEPGK